MTFDNASYDGGYAGNAAGGGQYTGTNGNGHATTTNDNSTPTTSAMYVLGVGTSPIAVINIAKGVAALLPTWHAN